MILQNPHPTVVIPDTSISTYMMKNLAVHGNRVALIDGETGQTYTFAEIRQDVIKCSSELVRLGVQPGDMVCMCCANCLEYAVVVIAAAACAAVVTTCNPNYTTDELIKQLSHSQPLMVFCNADNYSQLKKVAKHVSSIKHIFTSSTSIKTRSIQDLIRDGTSQEYPIERKVEPKEDTFLLPYSSGTTGLPKGVMLTHTNFISIIELSRVGFPQTGNDVLHLVLPQFHIYGMMMTMCTLAQGSRMVICKRFTVESFFKMVEKYKINLCVSVPPMVLAMYNSTLHSKYDLSSLKKVISGAAPLPLTVAEDVQKKMNLEIAQGWGLSEAVPLSTCYVSGIPLNSVGLLPPNTFLKCVDPDSGRELGPNEEGEICCKGPQVMKGYYKNPTATKQCIDYDGWFHTGDIGYFDELGFIYIVDRLKELIKYKGFQVAPAELEAMLLDHPDITDVAVIGVPDVEAGEVPKAFLVKSRPSLTASEIHKFLEGRVSKFKYLRGGVEFVDIIPKSASGKILRRELRAKEKLKKSKL
uniref:4-coumarate--CoA ligase 1-like n=1 Tax=Ciona intestinalis TaxID=7719 RepID=UPI000052424A|nr:4-coumarate--CoA ligase 1-like [Ciona intestinalis]XP_026689706.1 4-coumarate--CoA ligase 1-like [Ciona intestinalis]|eukprot:XP_002127963.1 4-coumarate--CoA ligase 1-like [Ciona intestinalis]